MHTSAHCAQLCRLCTDDPAREGAAHRAVARAALSAVVRVMSGAKSSSMGLIPLPGVGTLELTREQYEAALRPITAASAASGATAGDQPAARLVTAKALAVQLSLPVSCVYEYAKAKRIPCIRVGKHVRFNPAAVRAALATASAAVGRE